MPRHAEPRRRRSVLDIVRSARTRAILSLGIVLGFGTVSTMAFWTDDATMTTGSFESGTLDVRLNAATNNVGQGGTWNNTSLTLTNAVPGESFANAFPVRNDGTVPFTFTATATASGALAPQLLFWTYTGGTATNTGTVAGGNRNGTCNGTLQSGGANGLTLSGTSSNVVTAAGNPGAVAAGSSRVVCIRVQLTAAAPNGSQGHSGAASFVFNATQVAP